MRDPNKTQAELAALCRRVAELETPCAGLDAGDPLREGRPYASTGFGHTRMIT